LIFYLTAILPSDQRVPAIPNQKFKYFSLIFSGFLLLLDTYEFNI